MRERGKEENIKRREIGRDKWRDGGGRNKIMEGRREKGGDRRREGEIKTKKGREKRSGENGIIGTDQEKVGGRVDRSGRGRKGDKANGLREIPPLHLPSPKTSFPLLIP